MVGTQNIKRYVGENGYKSESTGEIKWILKHPGVISQSIRKHQLGYKEKERGLFHWDNGKN